jgi:hypothetical protein
MNTQQQAFIEAYRLCIGNAPTHELEYFFQYKDKAQEGDFRDQQLVREGAEYWNGIEDAWELWLQAMQYAQEVRTPKTFEALEAEKPADFRNY